MGKQINFSACSRQLTSASKSPGRIPSAVAMQYNWTRSMRKEPSSILETVLRVALYQPVCCSLSANVSCVQPRRLLRHRLTSRPMKFRCFTSSNFPCFCVAFCPWLRTKYFAAENFSFSRRIFVQFSGQNGRPVHFSMRLHFRCPKSGTPSLCRAIVSSNAARVVRITNKVLAGHFLIRFRVFRSILEQNEFRLAGTAIIRDGIFANCEHAIVQSIAQLFRGIVSCCQS